MSQPPSRPEPAVGERYPTEKRPHGPVVGRCKKCKRTVRQRFATTLPGGGLMHTAANLYGGGICRGLVAEVTPVAG